MEADATFRLDTARILRVLVALVVGLQALHLVTLVLRYGLGDFWLHGFVPMFDTDHEKNAPTYFSALNMLLCAQLLALIAAIERRRRSPAFAGWVLLTVIFVLLPFDELFELHEFIGRAVKATLHTSGVFGYAWVIPYGLLTAGCAVLLLRLLAKAPADTRARLVVSGAVYVAGAIALEMLGSWIIDRTGGEKTLAYALSTTVEELLEMSGIVLFTRALLLHLERYAAVIEIAGLRRPAPEASTAGTPPAPLAPVVPLPAGAASLKSGTPTLG